MNASNVCFVDVTIKHLKYQSYIDICRAYDYNNLQDLLTCHPVCKIQIKLEKPYMLIFSKTCSKK